MDSTVVDNPGSGRFEILVDERVVGFAAYQRSGTVVLFTHTEIDESVEGHGLGSVLASAALDAVRGQKLSALSMCPFIRGYIERHSEYLDLVPAEARIRYGLAPAGASDLTTP